MSDDWRYAALHTADGTPLLVLTGDPDTDPLLVEELDLGAVDVRESTDSNSNGDGVVDTTANTGSRGISATITARGNEQGSCSYWLGKLRGLMHPSRRCYLHLRAADWPATLRVLVRGASAPHNLTDPNPTQQFQWKSPTGWLEAVVESTVELLPTSTSRPGRTYPRSYPRTYPQAYPSGSQPFDVDGEIATDPVIDLYGPCSGVTAFVDAQGRMWRSKASLAVPAGTFWRLDPSRPSLVDADGQSQYGAVDFSVTNWAALRLEPEDNRLVFTAQTAGPGCKAILRYRARSS